MPSAFFISWFDSFVVHWEHTHWAAIGIGRIPLYGRVVKYFLLFVFNDGVNRRSCEEHDHGVKTTYITVLKTFSSHFLYFILLTWWFSQVFELNCIICGYSEILNWSFINWLVKKFLIEYKLWIFQSAATLLGWLTQGLNNGTVHSTCLPNRSPSSTLPYRVHVEGSNTYIP